MNVKLKKSKEREAEEETGRLIQEKVELNTDRKA